MIKDLSHVPNKPGVYQFFDSSKIIYIGKAKDLNKRVRSYFTPAIKDRKTEQIKKQAIKVETFATHSETEALILEQQLKNQTEELRIKDKKLAEESSKVISLQEETQALQQSLNKAKEDAKENGYAMTASGRKSYLPDIHSKNPMMRNMAERMAIG